MQKYWNKNIGWLWIVILAGIPVLLWFLGTRYPSDSAFVSAMAYIGQVTALVGTALFALSIIMSGRFRWLEKIFAGLNEVYVNHHKIGQVALVLLLAHPIFLIGKYSGGTWAGAAQFLLPGQDMAKTLGFYGLALMLLALILTLYLSLAMKYNVWKFTHKFLGIAFVIASLHIWFIPSDTSRNLPLRYYMLTLSVIAIVVFVYHSLLHKYLVPQTKYVVKNLRRLNDTLVEIEMSAVNKKLNYQAGQFSFFSFQDDQVGTESHPFTISSSPKEENLFITVKNLGDYTANISKVKFGAEVLIQGPFGAFSYKKIPNKKQVWIAGGIGVTPFLSMLKDFDPSDDYQIDFYYCVRNKEELFDVEKIKDVAVKVNNKIKVTFYL